MNILRAVDSTECAVAKTQLPSVIKEFTGGWNDIQTAVNCISKYIYIESDCETSVGYLNDMMVRRGALLIGGVYFVRLEWELEWG